MRYRKLMAEALLFLPCGCAGKPESDRIVPIDQVPKPVMEAARKELPGYTFDTVYSMKVDGKDAYEVRGKNKQGKVREVEVTAAGDVLGIE